MRAPRRGGWACSKSPNPLHHAARQPAARQQTARGWVPPASPQLLANPNHPAGDYRVFSRRTISNLPPRPPQHMQGWAPWLPRAEAAPLILLPAAHGRDERGRRDLPAASSRGRRALQLPRAMLLLLLQGGLSSSQGLTVGHGFWIPSPWPALLLWPHRCPQLPVGIVASSHIPSPQRCRQLFSCFQLFLNPYPEHQAVAQCPVPMPGGHLWPPARRRQAAKALPSRHRPEQESRAPAGAPWLATSASSALALFVLPPDLLGPGTISGSFYFLIFW